MDAITKTSSRTVSETVDRFVSLLKGKGLQVFAVIDQRAAAKGVGLDLVDTVLVLFGSPAAGTPVMQAVPLSALDLPLKVLVWTDAGRTAVSYLDPRALAARYGIPDALAANLEGINPLTDALVAD